MRLSPLRLKATVTLFTRPNCGLCEHAKDSVRRAWDSSTQKFDYVEKDITKSDNKEWFDKYAFDVPVIHIENNSKLNVFMHRISQDQVVEVVDQTGVNGTTKE